MRLLILFLLLTSTLSAQLIGDTEQGLASFYSDEYEGAETAYGLRYHADELVAGHRTLPLNTIVKVTNLNNQRSVRVRIIDKGPFIRGRIVEVSKRAARQLGMLDKVTVPASIEVVALPGADNSAFEAESEPNTQASKTVTRRATPDIKSTPKSRPAPEPESSHETRPAQSPAPAPEVAIEIAPQAKSPEPPVTKVIINPAPSPTNAAPAQSSKTKLAPQTTPSPRAEPIARAAHPVPAKATTFSPGIYRVALHEKPTGIYGVQVASFTDLEPAMERIAALQAKWFSNLLLERAKQGNDYLYRVILGPFSTPAEAKRYAGDLQKRYKIEGFVKTLE